MQSTGYTIAFKLTLSCKGADCFLLVGTNKSYDNGSCIDGIVEYLTFKPSAFESTMLVNSPHDHKQINSEAQH